MNPEREREDGKEKQQEKKRKLAPELAEPDHAKEPWPRMKVNFQSTAKSGIVPPKLRLSHHVCVIGQ